ncbi:uncharacterized protein N7479_008014 [Penicillium vulpinum]|uniref:uncharacterized protein n=1 Tax=Penicillium vulpinum TaxID=29845 RepID=UPI0025498303|nr:uncharacterized protein N7479_008014 [Penicillium vulpinum]KAJ5960864.1 hypothetical protein N7479_008014 [Penicillium vulpinum]
MSYYITILNGPGVDESPENLWVNLGFTVTEYFKLRTDGALICFMLERIRELKFKLTREPWDRRSRWCISIPVSKMHKTMDGAANDALQLVQWYKTQVLNGNATINRELLFDRRPFHDGRECCRNNVCDRVLHPEWWGIEL